MIDSVIPVAGLGTRSLPASKVIPKEMLPVYNRPIIQHIVEEAIEAGAGNITLVTSRGKSAIEDHFDLNLEVERALESGGKVELLEDFRRVSRLIDVKTIRQKQPLGLGHAVLTAKSLVTSSPFAVLLGDDLIDARPAGLAQLIEKHKLLSVTYGNEIGVVMLSEVGDGDVSKYGICEVEGDDFKVSACKEKPRPSETKSRLAIIGRYLLPRDVFQILEGQDKGKSGEIQLTDALNVLAQKGRLFGCVLQGQRFDAGDRLGFLKANIHFYLKSPLAEEVRTIIREANV